MESFLHVNVPGLTYAQFWTNKSDFGSDGSSRCTYVIFLGLILGSKLLFEIHIKSIIAKMNYSALPSPLSKFYEWKADLSTKHKRNRLYNILSLNENFLTQTLLYDDKRLTDILDTQPLNSVTEYILMPKWFTNLLGL